ncbi:MAG: response regulator transcription factor [Thermomicrobiales bacterium]
MIDYHLGIVAYGQGHLDLAVERLGGARKAAIALDEAFIPLWCLVYLVFIACERHDLATAAQLMRQHPDLDRVGYHQHQPLVRAAAGVLACEVGNHETAARLLGATAHDVLLRYPERVITERSAHRSRLVLGDERYTSAWKAGRRMRQHEVEAEIHRLLSADADWTLPPQPSPAAASGLSPRELDVLRYLTEGLTNQLIADALFLSTRTVDNHVAHILGRLDVGSRTAAVAYAIRNNLV